MLSRLAPGPFQPPSRALVAIVRVGSNCLQMHNENMNNSLDVDVVVPTSLVDVGWLAANAGAPNLVILDASAPPVVPGLNPINAEGPFKAIPGARRFDFDKDVCKPDTSLPHMLPGPELFQQKVRALGVNADSAVVVYDDCGMYASPRAWWMFRAMGHDNVAVLDGGLPAWAAADAPLADSLDETAPQAEVGDRLLFHIQSNHVMPGSGQWNLVKSHCLYCLFYAHSE